jgi:hypothetical protein
MDDKMRKRRHKPSPGSSHGMSKLRDDQVRLIRNDDRSLTKIAVDYCVSPTTIGQIKRRERWKHLQ